MIRLLMGITLSEIGGSQQIVFQIIKHLPEPLYEVTLITAPYGELIDWITDLNINRTNKVKVIPLPCIKRNISPFYDLIFFIKLLRILKNGHYDIAHYHTSKMGIIGRAAAKIIGIPKIFYTVHGWGLNKSNTGSLYPIINYLEKKISKFSSKIIFVSKKDREHGIRQGWASYEASCVIYNSVSEENFSAVNIRRTLNIPDDLPVISFVARLAEPKDPVFAIQVCENLIRRGIEHILLIIGDGPKYSECQRIIKTEGLENYVIMLGNRQDVREILKHTDIFCLFSKWEGLPVSILEAMISGLPVIANDVGGISELIIHNENGYLLDRLGIREAADYMRILITDQEKRTAMGIKAKEHVHKNFNLESMIQKYRKLYEE